MNEAVQVYHDDVRSRSIVKKSVANKKHGSATQKLGNRRMSWQEIASKHGDVKSWCMEDFLDYKVFITMPLDLQVEYVNKICDKYDVSIKYVSQYLFNKGGDGLRAYLRNNNIFMQCNPRKIRGETGLLQFQNDIEEWKRREKMAAEIDAAAKEEHMNDIPAFMEYQQFKKLNPDDALKFLNDIINYYQIGYSTVAKVLFQIKEGSLLSVVKRMGIEDLIIKRDKKFAVSPAYKEGKDRFTRDVELWRGGNGEMIKKLDEEPAEEKTINDIFSEFLEPKEAPEKVVELVPEPIVEEVKIEEPKKEEPVFTDPTTYHDSSFTTSYVREGLDMDELMALNMLFRNKKVCVRIDITVV